jgi:hypothetical protein
MTLVTSHFSRARNSCRCGGNPIRLGINRRMSTAWTDIFGSHVSGIDPRHHLAIVPRGTCGNTIHRLVTNIQRFLDPSAKAFIGNKRI